MNTTIDKAIVSPRFTEYGRLSEMKNDLKTLNTVLSSVTPRPKRLFVAKAVKYHEVMVSGTVCGMVKLPELPDVLGNVFELIKKCNFCREMIIKLETSRVQVTPKPDLHLI